MTEPAQTEDPFLAFLLTILTPLLASASLTDATRAAKQALAAYNTNAADQLLTIAQIVGFALASLDNLALSAAPDLSLSMKLKLRGNANALNRSTQRSTTALEAQRHQNPVETSDVAATEAEAQAETQALAALEQARTELRKPEPAAQSDQDRKNTWASAMTDVAAECSRNLANLPPRQRRAEVLRITALSNTARHLARGGATPSKSDLLTTTTLSAFQGV
jgi:hypothetical protein